MCVKERERERGREREGGRGRERERERVREGEIVQSCLVVKNEPHTRTQGDLFQTHNMHTLIHTHTHTRVPIYTQIQTTYVPPAL